MSDEHTGLPTAIGDVPRPANLLLGEYLNINSEETFALLQQQITGVIARPGSF